MKRFRLKFMLQELDLVGPEVVLGRSPDCHLTIEDPLVSRQHARIDISDESAILRDLGSRNGVLVNGDRLLNERRLRDSDRIRIGTQELIFCVVDAKRSREARSTGFMVVCPACDRPYPEVSPSCPHCGAARPDSEDTVSGLVIEPRRSWAFQLLGEVIERALREGRLDDAERMLRRAAEELDERRRMGEQLPQDQLTIAADFALRVADLGGALNWLHWVLNVHRDHGAFPQGRVLDRLENMDVASSPDALAALGGFVEWARSERERFRPAPDEADLARLSALASAHAAP